MTFSICEVSIDAMISDLSFEKTFSRGGIPDDITEIEVASGTPLVDILLSEKIVESKTEWRRLVGDGAVTEMTSEEKISDTDVKVQNGTYKIGKRRFVKIVVK